MNLKTQRAAHRRMMQLTAPERSKPITAETIARDVAAFRRAGGRVQHLPIGETSTPLRFVGSMRAISAATWRERESIINDGENQ